MRSEEGFTFGRASARVPFLLLSLIAIISATAVGQVAGNNDVYNSQGSNKVGSSAFIDVTGLPQGSDMCQTIYRLFSGFTGYPTYPAAGAVVDARGISGSALICSSGTPWFESGNNYANVPSTILLPAGVIVISNMWTLPDGTKIIGEGAGGVETGSGGITFVSATSIQASQNFSDTVMIQMGDSTHCNQNAGGPCHSISVEDLALDGQNTSGLGGILNTNSQELSYVNRVNMYRILGIGLNISGSAQNSGPYSNIVYNTGGTTPGTCAQIYVQPPAGTTAGTRGIHGLTCDASSDSQVAILLDSSNNSLEDIRIVGFYDGVRIGSQNSASSNVLHNIYGDTSRMTPYPVYVIHIESKATDTAIMGVSNVGGSGTVTIQDDNLNKMLPPITDPYVSLYALGSVDSNSGGYSRITTSPIANAWATGAGDPANNPACTVPGSLYSNATASQSNGGTALWVCASSGTWKPVI